MEQLTAVLDFIGDNESLFSGVAALIAIVGVCGAFLLRLGGTLRADGAKDRAGSAPPAPTPSPKSAWHQEIRYTRNADGQRLAFTEIGEGYPLVRSLGWFTNLELEWDDPLSRASVEIMANRFRYLRYDARGIGMSERAVEEVNAATRLADLEAVMDAAGVERCVLMGLSEGGTTAIEYAARHPERVSHLVLWGSFLRRELDEAHLEQWSALLSLLPKQWGGDNRSFLQLFTSMFLPDGNAEQNRLFNLMQKESASAEVVQKTIYSIGKVDVTATAAALQVPTLVLHRRGDLVVPQQQSVEIAATIPGAKLVLMPGSNHWIHCDPEAYRDMVAEIEQFVGNPASAEALAH